MPDRDEKGRYLTGHEIPVWVKHETHSCPVSPYQMVTVLTEKEEHPFSRFAGMYSNYWGDEDGVKDWWNGTIISYKIVERKPMSHCVENVSKWLESLGIHHITPREIETIVIRAGIFIRDNMTDNMVAESEKEQHSPGDGFRSAMCEALTEISTAAEFEEFQEDNAKTA